MTDEANFEREISNWFRCDLRYEGVVGEKMRANFSINSDMLPQPLAVLMQRLREREMPLQPEMATGLYVRSMGPRDSDLLP